MTLLFPVVINRQRPNNDEGAAMAMKIVDSMLAVAAHYNSMRLQLTAFNITLCGVVLALGVRYDEHISTWPVVIFLLIVAITFFLISFRIGIIQAFHWDEYVVYRTLSAQYYGIEISNDEYSRSMSTNINAFGKTIARLCNILLLQIWSFVNFTSPVGVSIHIHFVNI